MSQKEFRGRLDALLHERIKSAAKDSFRSMSAEIVYRLAKSLEQDGAGAGKPTSKASSTTSGVTMQSAVRFVQDGQETCAAAPPMRERAAS